MNARTVSVLVALFSGTASAGQPEGFSVMGKQAASHPYLGEASAVAARPPGSGDAALVLTGILPSAVIAPDSLPVFSGSTALSAADCPGQYGPVAFLAWSAKACDLVVKVSDLKSAAGAIIGSENFDVRFVRYVTVTQDKKAQVTPLLLEAPLHKALPAAGLAQVWITYFVPPGIAAGVYAGTVTVTAGDNKATLPLQLTIYPFQLTEPDLNLYIAFLATEDPKRNDHMRQELIDQRCHGMTCSQLAPPVTRDGALVEASMARMLDVYKSVGFSRASFYANLYNRITCEWLNKPDKSIGMWGPWFRYYPFTDARDARFVGAVKTIHDQAAARGLKLILAVADEPGSHPWTTEATQHYDDLARKSFPDVLRESTVGGGWAMKRDEDQLWKDRINIWTANRWLPEKIALVRQNDPRATIQVYNMAGGGSEGGGTQASRLFYGFFSWKARVGGTTQWCYSHPSTPQHNYTWPPEDLAQGNVPTLRWEAVREGAKDRRYLATLEQLLETRKTAGGEKAKAVAAARKCLQEIADAIQLTSLETYDAISGGHIPAHPPGTYEQWRAQIAACIVSLQ